MDSRANLADNERQFSGLRLGRGDWSEQQRFPHRKSRMLGDTSFGYSARLTRVA
jgi:hypothetical protein